MQKLYGPRFASDWRRTLLIAGLFTGGISGAALAQDVDDSADSAKVTTGTGMLPAFVTAGVIDSNGKVPAFNAVAGSAVTTFAISFPLTVLTHGQSYCISVALQDYNVTGKYEVDYYIKQKVNGVTKTILQQKIVGGQSTSPGDVFAWTINSNEIPDSPGVATLYGRVKWGTGYSIEAVVSSNIVIE